MDVLFVDDEVDFLKTLMKRMKKRNVAVTGVHSGEEAVELLHRAPADVVVLDFRMSGMNGLQTLKEIKKVNSLIEVIMLTGLASLKVAKEGMELGAFDYLIKPVDIDELLYKIQDAFKKKTIQEDKINKIRAMIRESGKE